MAINAAGRNAMLNALGALITHASLHSANPGGTGASEIAGGSPAYARKAITWAAASAGSMAASNTPVFDVEGGDTAAWVGFWGAVSGGTNYGDADITDEVFGGQGTYTLTGATITCS